MPNNLSRGIEKKQEIEKVYNDLIQVNNAFSIESLVYAPFLHQLMSEEMRNDISLLSNLIKEVTGKKNYVNTYAFKFNFAKLLEGNGLEGYEKLLEFINLYKANLQSKGIFSMPENFEELCENLYQLCYERIQVRNLADLIVTQLIHISLSLPEDKNQFNIYDVYSGVFPSEDNVENVEVLINYISRNIQKLRGEEILYVDIRILPEGNFVINTR